ncbi:hypothetical protein H2200_003244 [Cladophialophora chaetospira]|uniref:Uncharacterized protein n=1 Tax=Cladophialophora chaetospira TaxID=386627 RepID=A0AA38XH46_9EURO|nr:hypothetical protein H2200_003244 [Cladophialophora chaetospira]
MFKILWLLLLCCVLAVVNATPNEADCAVVDGKVPLGINFGMTHITAACLDTNNTPIAVARLQGSESYADYVADILKHEGVRFLYQGEYHVKVGEQNVLAPPDEHDSALAESVFKESLEQITGIASSTLAANFSIGAIVLPHHYNETTYMSLFNTAVQVDPAFDRQPSDIRYFYIMTARCYTTEYCTLPRTNRPLDHGLRKYVILVNHDLDRLDIMAGVVSDMGPSFYGKTTILDAKVDVRNSTEWAHEAQFTQALSDIIDKHIRPYSSVDPFDDLDAVVLTGELSPAAISRLSAAMNMPVEHQHKIQTANAEYRGAFGAACEAYLMIKYPPPPVCVLYMDFGKEEL